MTEEQLKEGNRLHLEIKNAKDALKLVSKSEFGFMADSDTFVQFKKCHPVKEYIKNAVIGYIADAEKEFKDL